jgi:hypothetical protein
MLTALAVIGTAVAATPAGHAAAEEEPVAPDDAPVSGVDRDERAPFTEASPDGLAAQLPSGGRPGFVVPAGLGEASLTLTPARVARPAARTFRVVADPQITRLEGAVADTSVVQENPWQATDLHYLTDDVRAQMIFELKDASAPTVFDVAVSLPAGARLVLNEQVGAVFVVDATENVVGVFAQPWAVDATGLAVPTEFEIVGNTLRQHVQHQGAAYPVMADPQYTWGWVTGTAYYNRRETKNMTTLAYGATVVAGLCAAFGAQTLGVACAISAAFYAQWAFQADRAFGEGRCLKIKVPTFEAGSYPFGERVCTDKVS